MAVSLDEPKELAATATGLITGLMGRVMALGKAWMELAAQTAAQEAQRDAARIGSGVGLAAAGGGMLLVAAILGETAAVMALHDWTGWTWPLSTLAVATPNLLIGIVLLLIARSKFNEPVLPQTRILMKKSAQALSGK